MKKVADVVKVTTHGNYYIPEYKLFTTTDGVALRKARPNEVLKMQDVEGKKLDKPIPLVTTFVSYVEKGKRVVLPAYNGRFFCERDDDVISIIWNSIPREADHVVVMRDTTLTTANLTALDLDKE